MLRCYSMMDCLTHAAYGSVERKDRQPIQRIGAEETPAMGGMEMTQ